MVPPDGRIEPESAPNSSSWPCPSSATTPATSPSLRSNETSLSLVPTRRLRTPRRGGPCAAGPASLAAANGGARLLDACAEHQLDDLFLGAGRHVDDADGLAVAQHGGAVAERRNLDEAMRDEDDGASGLALAAHDVEHPLGEVGRQRGGHLVEQQHVGLDRQRARQVEHAQHGERDVARGLAEIEIGDAELADPVEERRDRRAGETKVGGDVEIGDQRRLLIDRNQPGAPRIGGRMHLAGLAADQDAAGIVAGSRRSGS